STVTFVARPVFVPRMCSQSVFAPQLASLGRSMRVPGWRRNDVLSMRNGGSGGLMCGGFGGSQACAVAANATIPRNRREPIVFFVFMMTRLHRNRCASRNPWIFDVQVAPRGASCAAHEDHRPCR